MSRYKSFGSGPVKILIMHNWFSDNSVYAPILPHINPEQFQLVFMDLRGYGEAKEVAGKYSLQEIVNDAIAVANHLQWSSFHVMGHSMSSMAAQKLALEYPSRVLSVIGIAPIPPSGSKQSPELITFLERAALDKKAGAMECIHILTNRRYSDYIADKMAEKWHNCSTSQARLAYLQMFSYTDFSPLLKKGLSTPMLLLRGEHDAETDEDKTHKNFLQWYPNALLESCKHSGHFPMQENPLYLATRIEHFLAKQGKNKQA